MTCFDEMVERGSRARRDLMWTQRFDLHSHSTNSDGQHEVAYVAELMRQQGVNVWALTDHDTTNGWEQAAFEASSRGIQFVPGVEITCTPACPPMPEILEAQGRERASSSWHLLAYFPQHNPAMRDESIDAFKQWLMPRQLGREPRMRLMCKRLEALGMPVNIEKVLARADGSVGRPHLAEEMVKLGYVQTKQQAFEQWLGDGLPAFVAHEKPTIAEAVEAVKSAGGFTSLAHPVYYGVDVTVLMNTLQDLGVDAVEAVHRSHADMYRYALMKAAEDRQMGITVGSDFHGLDYQQHPGCMPVMLDALHPMLTE